MNLITILIIIFSILYTTLITWLFYKSYTSYKNSENAINYSIFNQLYCKQNNCVNQLENLTIINSIQNSYDRNIALYCGNLINYILENKTSQPINGLSLIGSLQNINEPGIFGCIWYDNINDIMWIAFRGTQYFDEWLQDFDYKENSALPAKHQIVQHNIMLNDNTVISSGIHDGFLQIFDNFRDNMYKMIDPIKPQKIIVTGHSLGAAIATITGVDLKNTGYDTFVYNFASPRVGDQSFYDLTQNLNLPIYRLVNTEDVIPTDPLAVEPNFSTINSVYTYIHVGELHAFTVNTLSIANNHYLPVYITALKNQLI